MVKVLRIQVFYHLQSGETKILEQEPTSQDIDDIKLDIGRIVKHQIIPMKPNVVYYYVVLKTKSARSTVDNKGNKGKVGYRTVVPKIML